MAYQLDGTRVDIEYPRLYNTTLNRLVAGSIPAASTISLNKPLTSNRDDRQEEQKRLRIGAYGGVLDDVLAVRVDAVILVATGAPDASQPLKKAPISSETRRGRSYQH